MELRVLRYFLAVAREESFTKAAKFLHVTQPTLSRQIQELEEELNQRLLFRNNHTVSLTHEGLFLQKRAEEIIAMVEKTEAAFQNMEDDISGTVHIGSGEFQAIHHINLIMKELTAEYPQIKYNLHSGNSDDVLQRLDAGLLDFGVLLGPSDLSKYDYVTLPDKNPWCVVMRKDSPLAAKATITRKDLLTVPIIMSNKMMPTSGHKNQCVEWFGLDFEKLNIVATRNLLFNAALMVEDGLGVTLCLDNLLNVLNHESLCSRLLEPKLESGISIAWKKYQVFSPAAKVFLDKILEKFN